MERKWVLTAFAIVGLAVMYFSLSSTEESLEGYTKRINAEREQNEFFMKHSEESPFRAYNVPFNNGLEFFEIDRNFAIEAELELFEVPVEKTILTNTGEKRQYREMGWAKFEKNQVTYRLLVYASEDSEDSYFIPFKDLTSSKSTYGAGRYLEAKVSTTNKIILDFNLAYNPYCAYVPKYSCPLPPKENELDLLVEAGEKSYPK